MRNHKGVSSLFPLPGGEGQGEGERQNYYVPLPTVAQARVDSLLGSSRLLAAEIAHTRPHAAHLLQAVLKEAFTPAA